MLRSLSALLITVAVASMGCAAVRHPAAPTEPLNADELRRDLSRWVVGVREPELRYVDPRASGPDVLDEVRDAGHLIEALRSTGLFAEVDFTRQLDCPPNIELVAVTREQEGIRLGPPWLWALTLSLVALEEEEGVFFAPAGTPSVTFDFPYPTTLVVGVVPLVASPLLIANAFPTWSYTSQLDMALERFLLLNVDRLRAVAADPARPGDDERRGRACSQSQPDLPRDLQ